MWKFHHDQRPPIELRGVLTRTRALAWGARRRGAMDWTRKAGLPLLFLLAAVAGPTPASAADATMYELVESMSIVQHDGRAYRQAWAAIDGTARPGTLLCPFQVTCTLVGWGWSNVETITGKGTFSGSFTVVVDGDNAVDGPEASVLSGRFGGTMDFSPALLARPPQPYGTVVGTVTVGDRKSTRLNSSHTVISYAVFCLKKTK